MNTDVQRQPLRAARPTQGLSDEEIDRLVLRVMGESCPRDRPREEPPGSWRSLWYLAMFLLGMTFMEGLRFVAPGDAPLRGTMVYRCGGAPAPESSSR